MWRRICEGALSEQIRAHVREVVVRGALAVLIAFPVFGIYGLVTETACFFRRNSKGRDFSKFNERVTQHIQRSPCQGIVVYPEGTRNIKPESLPLRRGMIRYAYAEWSPSKS